MFNFVYKPKEFPKIARDMFLTDISGEIKRNIDEALVGYTNGRLDVEVTVEDGTIVVAVKDTKISEEKKNKRTKQERKEASFYNEVNEDDFLNKDGVDLLREKVEAAVKRSFNNILHKVLDIKNIFK